MILRKIFFLTGLILTNILQPSEQTSTPKNVTFSESLMFIDLGTKTLNRSEFQAILIPTDMYQAIQETPSRAGLSTTPKVRDIFLDNGQDPVRPFRNSTQRSVLISDNQIISSELAKKYKGSITPITKSGFYYLENYRHLIQR